MTPFHLPLTLRESPLQSLFSLSAGCVPAFPCGVSTPIGGAARFDGVAGLLATAEFASLICRSDRIYISTDISLKFGR